MWLIASDTHCDRIELSWENVDAFNYRLLRDTVLIYVGTALSYTDNPAVGTYNYVVKAYDPEEGIFDSGNDSGTRKTAPPTAPLSFSATDTSCANVTITWANPSFSGAETPDAILIFRGTDQIADLNWGTTSHVDTPVAGTYTYSARYYNICGNSPTASDSGTRRAIPQYAAIGFVASDGNCDNVVLSWNIPTEYSYSTRDGWYVYRDTTYLGSVGSNNNSYIDYPSSGTYTYKVIPYNACGDGWEATDSGTRLNIPTVNVSGLSSSLISGPTVVLSYTAGNGSYREVHRKIGAGAYSWLNNTSDPSSYNDTTVIAGNTYTYKMREGNSCGVMATYSNETSIYVGNVFEDIIEESVDVSDILSDSCNYVDTLSESISIGDTITDSMTYTDVISESTTIGDSVKDIILKKMTLYTFIGDEVGKIYKAEQTLTSDADIGYDFIWVSKEFDIFNSPEEKDLFKTVRREEIKYRDLGATCVYAYFSIDGGVNWIGATNNPIPLAGANDDKIKSVFADIIISGKSICLKVVHGEAAKDFSLIDIEVDYEIRGFIKQEQ